MKFLRKLPVIFLVALIAVSCGKENSSGSGSNPGTGTTGFDIGTGVPTSQGTTYQSIDQVRSSFDSISMASGLAVGDHITRALPSNGFSFNVSVGGQNYANIYDIQEVQSVNDSSVNVRELTYFDNNPNTANEYGVSSTISKNSQVYSDMLLRGNLNCDFTEVRPATIYIVANGQQQTLNGTRINCISTSSILGGIINSHSIVMSAVYTDALPLAANPVTLEHDSIDLGHLVLIGNTVIQNVQ